MTDWGIIHSTSSPNYPQSNGLSEKAVQIAKRLMVKAAESKSDLYLALLEYQNTPIDGFAPAQIMVGRQLRSLLPSITQTLQPGAFQFDRFRQQGEGPRDTKQTL